MGLDPKVMSQMTKDKVNKFVELAKKDFSSLAKQYGIMCKSLVDNPEQRLVVYDDDTVDFFTKGTKYRQAGEQSPIDATQSLANELNISLEEAQRIRQMEPDDQVLEITRLRTLLDRDKPKKAQGGIIGLYI